MMGPPWRECVEGVKLWTKDRLLGNPILKGKAEEEGTMKENILEDHESADYKRQGIGKFTKAVM